MKGDVGLGPKSKIKTKDQKCKIILDLKKKILIAA